MDLELFIFNDQTKRDEQIFFLNDAAWEMKNPINRGYMSIWNQFKTAVFGHGKKKERNPQSDRLVISGICSGMNLSEMANYVYRINYDIKDSFPEIKEVILISKEGMMRIKR